MKCNMTHCYCSVVQAVFIWDVQFFSMFMIHVLLCQSFYEYGDLFSDTWRAFSDYDIIHLKTYDSKRVRRVLLYIHFLFIYRTVYLHFGI